MATTKKVYIDRLEKLAKFIMKLPDRKWKMDSWGRTTDPLNDAPTFVQAYKSCPHYEQERLLEYYSKTCPYGMYARDWVKVGRRAKGDYKEACNTQGCLAGWTCFLFPHAVPEREDVEYAAIKILGIDHLFDDSEQLRQDLFHNYRATRAQQAKLLRDLAKELKTR